MKNGRISVIIFLTLFFLSMGFLLSCDNPLSSDPKDPGNPGNPGSSGNPENPIVIEDNPATYIGLQFNLAGAKAILAAESDESSRNIVSYSQNVLFKVLEDDSVVSIFDFSSLDVGWIPRVRFIVHSPVQGSKDLFICFEQSWSYYESGNSVQVGSFIHVKEDGSVLSIIGHDPASWSYLTDTGNSNPVAFDGSGNMYFTVSESSGMTNTNVIYKYNPQSAALTRLSAAMPNIYYEHVALSSDGAFVVAKGSRYGDSGSVSFLRLIPTANPDAAEYLYYSSSGNSNINSFTFNPNTKEAFVSGYNLYRTDSSSNYQSGLFKISIDSASKVWTPILTNNYSYLGSFIYVDYIEHEYWRDELNWVDGYNDMIENWVPGYYEQDYIMIGGYYEPGEVWVDGYYGPGEVWVEGHYEPGEVWVEGHYEPGEVWVEGHYGPGEVWVDYYWDYVDTNWVEGYYEYLPGPWVDGHWEGGYEVGPYEVFDWHQDYKDRDGAPDYDKIMQVLYSYFKSEKIEFRYNNKINKEAFASMTQEDMRSIYNSYYYGMGSGFEDFCYRTGTNTKAVVNNYSFDSVSNLMIASNNSLWGTVCMYDNSGIPRSVFCQLTNSNGKIDVYAPGALQNKFVMKTIPSDFYVYYLADVSNAGIETGAQNIYRFSYDDPDKAHNLFAYIHRNISTIEVFSFAVGGDYLYFSGTQGTQLFTGKIQLSTLAYTELDFGYKVTAVVPY